MKKSVFLFLLASIAFSCQSQVKQDEQQNEEPATVEEVVGIAEGNKAPALSLPSLNGQTLSLNDLKGKYLVLDFWGSWCGWCIKGMPEMKNYYDRYADRLEILGIDCGDSEEKWQQTVNEMDLNWRHVRADKENPMHSNQLKAYELQGFPTKIILDADLRVVKYVIGEDPAFYTALDSLLNPAPAATSVTE